MSSPWWQEVRAAADLLTSAIEAEVLRANREGVYEPPPGVPAPRRRREPASLRHLAEVIRTHRMLPGVTVDKDVISGVLTGDRRQLVNVQLVVAVVRACRLIAGTPFGQEDAARFAVAGERLRALVEEAVRRDDGAAALLPVPTAILAESEKPGPSDGPLEPQVSIIDVVPQPLRRRSWPRLCAVFLAGVLTGTVGTFAGLHTVQARANVKLPCEDGAGDADIVDAVAAFRDADATVITPTLDFDQMNGSARYARLNGRTYYWGRAGSDDDSPASGGARVLWRTEGGRWHDCAAVLPVSERGYVHTPAVATTIGGRAIAVRVCLWREQPYRENCTATF